MTCLASSIEAFKVFYKDKYFLDVFVFYKNKYFVPAPPSSHVLISVKTSLHASK